jgi:hypothetical protein
MLNRHMLEMKIRRKIKLIRTAPHREKMRWAGYVLILIFMIMSYLKGVGLWPQ